MKIILCAAENKDRDVAFNTAQIKSFIEKTKEEAPDLLLFGEAFLQGFDSLSFNYHEDIKTAVSVESDAVFEIRKYAEKAQTAIGFGFIESDNGALFSSYLIVGKNGETICKYQRVSPGWRIAKTSSEYCEGDTFRTCAIAEKTLAVIICGDLWEDSLLARITALKADAFLWPVFCAYKKREWEQSIRAEYAARAAGVNAPVLFVNSRIGEEGAYSAGGAAVFFAGTTVLELPMEETGFLVYEF